MAHYRLKELELSTRVTLALEMLQPVSERGWGRVTALARTYGVSREFLYQLRDRAWDTLTDELAPRQPGPQVAAEAIVVDRELVRRAIVVLSLLKGSVGDIQQGLELLLGVHRSTGYISQTLKAVGERAELYNEGITVPLPILGEADEIFQGRKPCLTLVDGRSFLVLNLTPAECRDGTTWGITYLNLVERGLEFQDLACDGGTGLRAGVKEAGLRIPLRPDLFHILQEAHRLTRRLESAAYKAMENAERARQDDLQRRGIIRRRGRHLKIKVPLPQAEIEEARAIERFDQWCWPLNEMRQALEPITSIHTIVSTTRTKDTLETAIALLKKLAQPQITAFADDLQQKIPELMAPLTWLAQQLTPDLEPLDTHTQTWIIWSWQQRQLLNLDIDTHFPQTLRPVVQTVWNTLDLFHRSSSLAESLHSWLRPYLQIHRGMPKWLLPLLQLFWNHHIFQRGKRAGSSPLQLAGVSNVPSFAVIVDQLLNPNIAAQPI